MEMANVGVNGRLQVLSELIGRLNLATKLGTDTYGGSRDIYTALGYPKTVEFTDYWARYKRHDIAKAIIDRPVKASWKGEIEIIETVREKQTPFEKSVSDIMREMKMKSVFIRADKLTGIGRYSVLFLGLNDVVQVDDLRKPVSKTKSLKLLYVKPLSEKTAVINEYEKDTTNPRYGLPKYYNISIRAGSTDTTILVHYTRVIHLVEDLLEDEVLGTPRLEVVYNRLVDLEKLIGGDAEMFWRGARPGYTGTVDKDYNMSTQAKEDLKEQIDEFENNLRRILVNEGITYQALDQQISDPINHVDIQIQMISAVTGIPKRILTGSERGELSSAQDKLEWIAYVTSRREEQNEPMILRPFIDRCIELGLVPTPSSPYKVVWDKLFTLSDKEKVEIGEIRARTLKEYTMTSAQEFFPLRLFLEFFLNFDQTQIEEVFQRIKEEGLQEPPIEQEEEELMQVEPSKKGNVKKTND